MRLAEATVPKMTPEEKGTEDGALRGFSFCNAEETLPQILPRFAGKILFVADARSLSCLAPYVSGKRVLTVVSEKDALPLFSMPDGVGAVFAAGGEETVKAARFFAETRRVPCVLFPADGSFYGVFEPLGEILLGGKRKSVPLKEAEVYVDLQFLSPSLAEAFASLLLSRIALTEVRAMHAFSCAEMPENFAEAERAASLSGSLTQGDVALRNAALRRLGSAEGEGRTLARMHALAGDSFPIWRAFHALSALYESFFACGRPRWWFVPDYKLRASRAGAEYFRQVIPTNREYLFRTLALEGMRDSFNAELSGFLSGRESYERAFRALSGTEPPPADISQLRFLPERAPRGLSAVIRDFGLMEF